MKMTQFEQQDGAGQETYAQIAKSILSHHVPKVLLRLNITQNMFDITGLKYEFCQFVRRLDQNRVLNFYTNFVQYQRTISAKHLWEEILVAEKFEERMRRYKQQEVDKQKSYSFKNLKAIKTTLYDVSKN